MSDAGDIIFRILILRHAAPITMRDLTKQKNAMELTPRITECK